MLIILGGLTFLFGIVGVVGITMLPDTAIAESITSADFHPAVPKFLFPIFLALGILGPIVQMVAARMIYDGAGWARWLYLAWAAIELTTNFLATPNKMLLLPGLGVVLICCVYLFSAKANSFFEDRKNSTGVE